MDLEEYRMNNKRIEDMSFPEVPGWKIMQRSRDGIAYRKGIHTVIASVAVELDGKLWLHVSLARPDQMPTYKKMAEVKKLFIGEDKKAIQVFVGKDKHVNIHKFCLHLWHCVDGDDLPDFTQGGNTI